MPDAQQQMHQPASSRAGLANTLITSHPDRRQWAWMLVNALGFRGSWQLGIAENFELWVTVIGALSSGLELSTTGLAADMCHTDSTPLEPVPHVAMHTHRHQHSPA